MARKPVKLGQQTLAHAQRIGAQLRARRKALGVNMTVAAEAAGMSRLTWHRLEKGEPLVGLSFLLAAADALGMKIDLTDAPPAVDATATGAGTQLPIQIELANYPGLQSLAWQVGAQVKFLAPRDALGIYVRNIRHLDMQTLTDSERELMRALQSVFEELIPDV